MTDKIEVNGPGAHDVFKYLRGNTKEMINKENPTTVKLVPWNFCRWITDEKGKVQMYMNPTVALHNCYELVEFLCKMDNTNSKAMK